MSKSHKKMIGNQVRSEFQKFESANLRSGKPGDFHLNPENFRTYEDYEAHIASLVEDIRAKGVLTPLHVYANGVVADGNCRLTACQRLAAEGVEVEIPFLVVQYEEDKLDRLDAMFSRNDGEQFHALDQGRLFAEYREGGLNNTEIAKRVNRTSMHVGQMLTLHDATDPVRDAVRSGLLSSNMAVDTIRAHGEEILLAAIAEAKDEDARKVRSKHVQSVLDQMKGSPEAEVEDEDEAPFDGGTPVAQQSSNEAVADEVLGDDTPTADEADEDEAQPVDDTDEEPVGNDDGEAQPVDDTEEEEVAGGAAAPAPAPTTPREPKAPTSEGGVKFDAKVARAIIANFLPAANRFIEAEKECTNEELREAVDEFITDLIGLVQEARDYDIEPNEV